MKICGCVMAKNEELLLPECLNSLKQLTDIIIVVNNGSSDNTEKVAEEFGCILIDSPDTIVDEGRNEYINMANALGADWIFILDADERITSADAKLMRQACENAAMDVY
ncbi:glycosyltransferase, partial [Anaerocolumna sp.]|uniref:glycosyltransferase n=1 Tax=Anaerocolumna sp. TaxID=2041569 RepID=UPI0028B01747